MAVGWVAWAARLCLVAFCFWCPAAARAQALKRLDVDVFNSGIVWPLWVGQDKGMFAAHGLDIRLIPTPNSLAQMGGLIDGKFDTAMTAIDNLIAYSEGQDKAKTERVPNIVAVMGSDNGFLSLVSAPGIRSFDGLRGKVLSVDALTTGYAFVLRKMLELRGLKEGEPRARLSPAWPATKLAAEFAKQLATEVGRMYASSTYVAKQSPPFQLRQASAQFRNEEVI